MRGKKSFLILLGCILLFSSCGGRGEEESAAEGGNGPLLEAEEPNRKPQRTLTFGDEAADQSTTGSVSSAAGETTPMSMDRSRPFFSHAGIESHYPQDLIIGDLLVEREAGSEEIAVLKLLDSWFEKIIQAAKNGQALPDLDSMYAGAAQGIIDIQLATNLSTIARIEKIRYGRPIIEEGEARLKIRLFSEIGRSSAEVILSFQGGRWRILALDTNFSALMEKYTAPEYDKNPEVYGTRHM